MKIAMVASEANPLCKTGGLADVVYSLSRELAKKGEEVIVILPYYNTVKKKDQYYCKKVCSFVVPMAWRKEETNVYTTEIEGITYYLLENAHYYERDNLYGYFDDGERFAFMALASKILFSKINFAPDIIHVHDWQAGMLPCLIKEDPNKDKVFAKTKFVLSIHNPAFQGTLDKSALGDLYNLSDEVYNNGKVRLADKVSTLKSAIVYCDKILTVSPTHREELLTAAGGMGLSEVLKLREYDFSGILNGIDYGEFNPETDENIQYNFDVETFLKGKAENKAALLRELNIHDRGQPCFAIVSRITWQKGFDLVFAAAEELAKKGCNIVVLGSGEHDLEARWEDFRRRYPETCAIYIGYNDSLAHRVYAGSDFFFMPSLFEPCGLGQMIAQRYGSLPIVRRTGGLKDSVINYDSNNDKWANGFGFDEYSTYEMVRTCFYAYESWWNQELRKRLIENAMKTDNSWLKSSNEYMKIYNSLVK